MHKADLARLTCAVLVWTALFAPGSCPAESMSLDIDTIEWQRGGPLPTHCDIPLALGANVASVNGIVLKVIGVPREGSMLLCKGGCDSFPCHQTLHAYFLGYQFINSWTPLEGPAVGYEFLVPLEFADCYPDCYHPCTGKEVAPENWAFLKEGGPATLRLELMGDFSGCGATCLAEIGIERVTVMVDYEPLIREEYAAWGAMKSVYR
jgi:hypothetical protein